MEDLIKNLDVVFTLARMKQVEIAPQDEQAIINLINIKAELTKKLEDGSTTKNK